MQINTTIDGNRQISFEADNNHPLKVTFDGVASEIKIVNRISDTELIADHSGKKFHVKLLQMDAVLKKVLLKINGNLLEVSQEDEYDQLLKSLGMGAGAVKKVNDMKAPMPGVVLDVKISIGQEVKKDQGIVVLEAMKMENLLKSPVDGIIKSIEIAKGDTVEKNRVLVHFE